jgi:hypothetical protein
MLAISRWLKICVLDPKYSDATQRPPWNNTTPYECCRTKERTGLADYDPL